MGAIDQSRLMALLQGCAWGRPATVLASCHSTNTALLENVAGRVHGELLATDCQQAGRGQRTRSWWSGRGDNLALSVFLRPDCPAETAASLVLPISLAVREALAQHSRLPLRIKWPNDIVLGGRKLAGILCESRLCGQRVDALVVGIGVNVNSPALPADIATTASSLYIESGQKLDMTELIASIVQQLSNMLPLWWAGDGRSKDTLLEQYTHYSDLIGKRMAWHTGDGERDQGYVQGFSAEGALILQNQAGSRKIYRVGELSTQAPPP